MFTGIIEAVGTVTKLQHEGSNLHMTINAPFTSELKIDQSIAHNGVCLTVVEVNSDAYTVTAIEETLRKTNLREVQKGDLVNLERCLKMGDRLDGHLVQGHVDQVARVTSIQDQGGSWKFHFSFEDLPKQVLVEKGSVTINGVSLTVVETMENGFSVAIIPYTYDHTNFKTFSTDTLVNIEFDIIGKYVSKLMAPHQRFLAS